MSIPFDGMEEVERDGDREDGRTDLARIEDDLALDLFACHDLQHSSNPFCRCILVVVWILGHCQRRRREVPKCAYEIIHSQSFTTSSLRSPGRSGSG